MELQQLRYVVAVAEESSFTRAAARCFVVQSALSHQVKALERELGLTLFARTSRRVELTAAGEAFLPAARASLAAAARAGDDAAAAVGLVRGTLTIGAIPTVAALDLPAAIADFHRAHPAVRVVVRSAGSEQLQAGIARGEIDVAFLGLPQGCEPDAVAWRHLETDHHVALVGKTHPLAHGARIALADVVGETFADFPAGTPGRAQTDRAFERAGLRRSVTFEAMDAALMGRLVAEHLAVALLPSRVAHNLPGVATLALTDGPAREEYLAWSDFNPSPAAQAFVAVLDGMLVP